MVNPFYLLEEREKKTSSTVDAIQNAILNEENNENQKKDLLSLFFMFYIGKLCQLSFRLCFIKSIIMNLPFVKFIAYF